MDTFNPSLGRVGRQALNILHIRCLESYSLPIVSNTLPGDLFRVQRSGAEATALSPDGGGASLAAGYYTQWPTFASGELALLHNHRGPAGTLPRQPCEAGSLFTMGKHLLY